MICAFTVSDLVDYVCRQANSFFPDGRPLTSPDIDQPARLALDRTEHCFKHIRSAAYSDGKTARFDLLHSDQYCAFLYLLSNSVHRTGGPERVAAKLFYLNKSLHAFNCMYDTDLPEVFWIVHSVGIVLGKATYGNHLVVRQNCTVGALSGSYPLLGERVSMSAGSSIIGACRVGDNVTLGPGTTVIKADVPDNTLVLSNAAQEFRAMSDSAFKAQFYEF